MVKDFVRTRNKKQKGFFLIAMDIKAKITSGKHKTEQFKLPYIVEYHLILSATLLLTFAAGNGRCTSWPRTSLGKLLTHAKFVSCVSYDQQILG